MEELTMKVIKNILIFSLLILFVEAYAQSTNDNQTPLSFSGFMDNAMQKVQQFSIPKEVFYSSEKTFNGKTQETTEASLETDFRTNKAKLSKRSSSKTKYTVKVSNTSSKEQRAFSEKSNVKALLENNPCINRKGVFDAFGGKMLFAGVNNDKENDIPYAHYMWTGSGKNAGDTIRVTIDQSSGFVQLCELVSKDKKDGWEIVLCYSYVFANRENSIVPIRMIFKSIERYVSSNTPFEYTITNTITMNN